MKSALVLLWSASLVGIALSDPSIYSVDEWFPVDSRKSFHTKPPVSSSWRKSETEIFVGISHFRDQRCSATLRNIFTKAKFPDRVSIGLVLFSLSCNMTGIAQQIHTEKDNFDCIEDYCKQFGGHGCPRRKQLRIIEWTHQIARGPTYARYMQQSLLRNEEFCLQVDSHSDLVQDWDVKMLEMWGSISNEYAILSTIPVDISMLTEEFRRKREVPHVCQTYIDDRGMIVNLPPTIAKDLEAPLLTSTWSAGFSFSKCHADLKVPNDPNLQMLFEVDEFSRYARFWTRGYDVYSPSEVLVGHDFHNLMFDNAAAHNPENPNLSESGLGWEKNGMTPDFTRYLFDHSTDRLSTLLGFDQASKDAKAVSLLTKYGLGSKRTLDQFVEFTGVDVRRKIVIGDRCKQLDWVPFTFDKDPATEDESVWGKAPEMLRAGGQNIPIMKSGTITLYSEEEFVSGYSLTLQRNSAGGAGAAAPDAMREALSAKGLNLNAVPHEFIHRGKELWWIFQSIDTAVEALMNHIDETVGMGHGHKVVKLILLVSPIFFFVVAGAVWVLTNGKKTKFGGGIKVI